MGKFDGILLCTDLDDTLLKTDKSVSKGNLDAIEYFKREGGLFAFATGRVPLGARPVLEYVVPNAPSVCLNGGGIYDFEKKEMLWSRVLDEGALKAVEFVDENFPTAGIEVCTADKVYFCKDNYRTEEHKLNEKFPDNSLDYHDIKEKWNKVLFMVEDEEMNSLRNLIANSPFAEKYTFVRSSPWYYELLPKGANKGEGLIRLADLLGAGRGKVIAMGDNENDYELIKAAGIGIAVYNAVDKIKEIADYITVDNNSDAVAAVIADIESGNIKLH